MGTVSAINESCIPSRRIVCLYKVMRDEATTQKAVLAGVGISGVNGPPHPPAIDAHGEYPGGDPPYTMGIGGPIKK